ncbi:hypothetical protein Peur_057554 [Populus x canadensis]
MHLILISQKSRLLPTSQRKSSSQSSFPRNRLHLSNDRQQQGKLIVHAYFNVCLHLSSLFIYAQTIFIRETTRR